MATVIVDRRLATFAPAGSPRVSGLIGVSLDDRRSMFYFGVRDGSKDGSLPTEPPKVHKPKSWDYQTVVFYTEKARQEIPDILQSMAAHDTGKHILSDAEFSLIAAELRDYLWRLNLSDRPSDITQLLYSIRALIGT